MHCILKVHLFALATFQGLSSHMQPVAPMPDSIGLYTPAGLTRLVIPEMDFKEPCKISVSYPLFLILSLKKIIKVDLF